MFVADLHNDVLQRAVIGEDITKKSTNGHTDIVRLKESKINLEVFVIWVTEQHLKLNALTILVYPVMQSLSHNQG